MSRWTHTMSRAWGRHEPQLCAGTTLRVRAVAPAKGTLERTSAGNPGCSRPIGYKTSSRFAAAVTRLRMSALRDPDPDLESATGQKMTEMRGRRSAGDTAGNGGDRAAWQPHHGPAGGAW